MNIIYNSDKNETIIEDLPDQDHFQITIVYKKIPMAVALDFDSMMDLKKALDRHLLNLKEKFKGIEG